jgi:hypothetical protein
MTKYRLRLFLILSATVLACLILDWLAFHPSLSHRIAQNRIVGPLFVSAGIASLCFIYFVAKRFPHFAIGLAVLAAGGLLNLACAIGYFVLNLNSPWLDGLSGLSYALILLASPILIWQARRKSKAEKNAG